MIKNIIFDMDGVLTDSMPSHIRSWLKAFSNEGIIADPKEVALLEGANYVQIIGFYAAQKGGLASARKKRIKMLKDSYFDEKHIKPYRIMTELRSLKKRGIRLAVASGSTRKTVHDLLGRFYPGIFDCLICGDDVRKAKPEPDIYLKALKCIGGRKTETIVIENAPLGIESARKAGLKVYAICTTLDRVHLRQADRIFTDHRGLFAFLNKQLNL